MDVKLKKLGEQVLVITGASVDDWRAAATGKAAKMPDRTPPTTCRDLMALLKRAPNRIVAAVLAQPSGFRPELPDLFYQNNIKGWGPPLCARRPDIIERVLAELRGQPGLEAPRRLDRPQLRNHLPELLDRAGAYLHPFSGCLSCRGVAAMLEPAPGVLGRDGLEPLADGCLQCLARARLHPA